MVRPKHLLTAELGIHRRLEKYDEPQENVHKGKCPVICYKDKKIDIGKTMTVFNIHYSV